MGTGIKTKILSWQSLNHTALVFEKSGQFQTVENLGGEMESRGCQQWNVEMCTEFHISVVLRLWLWGQGKKDIKLKSWWGTLVP